MPGFDCDSSSRVDCDSLGVDSDLPGFDCDSLGVGWNLWGFDSDSEGVGWDLQGFDSDLWAVDCSYSLALFYVFYEGDHPFQDSLEFQATKIQSIERRPVSIPENEKLQNF